MNKEKRVLDFYVLCNKLKDVVRTGWKIWSVDRFRVESVAEHIYGVQMLAIAMWSEYQYDIDIQKVVVMLAVHEMEETIIGDITLFEKSKKDKQQLGHSVVSEIFKGLISGDKIKDLIFEYDKKETSEAKFAFFCDKLECDIQAKLYDEQSCVDLKNQENCNNLLHNKDIEKMAKAGMSWSEMWLTFGQQIYDYDENFLAVSNYAKNNKINNYLSIAQRLKPNR